MKEKESDSIHWEECECGYVDETSRFSIWDDKVTIDWYKTNETANEFTIMTASDLAGFAKLVNDGNTFEGKTIKLAININLNDKEWTPIGNGTRGSTITGNLNPIFKGTFDGCNYNISNLVSTIDLDNQGAGLFGLVGGNATIKNVIIESGTISNSKDAAAGIVAIILGEENESVTIEDCINKANVNGAAAAGILSRAYGKGSITITNCDNYGEISAAENESTKVGGIVCINNSTVEKTTISNCNNFGKVTGGDSGTAGIVGYANSNLEISECNNNGEIGDAKSKYVGGIIGYGSNPQNLNIDGCINNANVTGYLNVGGIAGIITEGQSDAKLSNNRNLGSVHSDEYGGGIVGYLYGGFLTECSNEASVYGEMSAGGIVGTLGSASVITNCSGGSEPITSSVKNVEEYYQNATSTWHRYIGYTGRLIGNVSNGPKIEDSPTLIIDDNNQDDYKDICTIGILACDGTSWGRIKVEKGTLIGKTHAGQATSKIQIGKDAKWKIGDEYKEANKIYVATRENKEEFSIDENLNWQED